MAANNQLFFNNQSGLTFPYGDVFSDNFNPQSGTYVDFGTGTSTITAGNMAVSGGTGFFTNGTTIQDVVWNSNNWYFKVTEVHTNTSLNEFGCVYGIKSVSGTQQESVYFGLYYFNANNTVKLDIFGSNPGLGQIATSANLTVNVNDSVTIIAEFVENVLTVTATNNTTSGSVSVSYTYGYTTAATNIKPNIGKYLIIAPTSTVNIKSIKIGTNYHYKTYGLFIGDSISSGYYQISEPQRYQTLYKTLYNKQIANFTGAGDRSVDVVNATNLNLIKALKPKKVHILIGTNDIANGVPLLTTQTNINTLISAAQSVGSSVYIGKLLPRNGQNNSTLNAWIAGLVGVTVIDYYTSLEGNPGDINPLYSDDNIHPNAAGAIVMKNLLVAAGF